MSGWAAELRYSIPVGAGTSVVSHMALPGAEFVIGVAGTLLAEFGKRSRKLAPVEQEVFDAMEVAAFPAKLEKRWLSAEEILTHTELFDSVESLSDQLRSMKISGLLDEAAGKWRVVW